MFLSLQVLALKKLNFNEIKARNLNKKNGGLSETGVQLVRICLIEAPNFVNDL